MPEPARAEMLAELRAASRHFGRSIADRVTDALDHFTREAGCATMAAIADHAGVHAVTVGRHLKRMVAAKQAEVCASAINGRFCVLYRSKGVPHARHDLRPVRPRRGRGG